MRGGVPLRVSGRAPSRPRQDGKRKMSALSLSFAQLGPARTSGGQRRTGAKTTPALHRLEWRTSESGGRHTNLMTGIN